MALDNRVVGEVPLALSGKNAAEGPAAPPYSGRFFTKTGGGEGVKKSDPDGRDVARPSKIIVKTDCFHGWRDDLRVVHRFFHRIGPPAPLHNL